MANEINIKVKVRGGKRTKTEIAVDSTAINKRKITFKNGCVLSDKELESIIYCAIKNFLNK